MFNKIFIFLLVILTITSIGFGASSGNETLIRNKRGFWAIFAGTSLGSIVGGTTVGLAVPAIVNSFECGQFGCLNGRCWSYCGVSLTGGEWCYTTKGYSQDFNYVSCSNADDCNGCWKCAGSCTV